MKLAVLLAAALALTGAAMDTRGEILAPLDQAVNAMFTAAGVPNRDATRVVPIVTTGGVTSGYAQITGPQARVNATRAVLKISTASPNGWSIDAFVPVTTISRVSGTIHREYGVAVDALVNGAM